MRAVRLEDTRGRKLAEFMTDHILGYIHGHKGFAVVDVERVADKVGCDGRAARPRLDGLASARLVRLLDFLEQVVVDEETLFDRTCHGAKTLNYFLPRGGRPLWRTRMRLLETLERRRVGNPLAN